jgi:hypothetical protein
VSQCDSASQLTKNLAHIFYQGLRLFPHIRIYANACVPLTSIHIGTLTSSILHSINDVTVPYVTSYVDLEDPFINHTVDELAVYANFLLYADL